MRIKKNNINDYIFIIYFYTNVDNLYENNDEYVSNIF